MTDSYDEDGLRDVSSVAKSEAVRREKERQLRGARQDHQDDLRARFASGEMSMAEYAKIAREAGIPATEVGAALQERASAQRRLAKQRRAAQSAAETVAAKAEKQPGGSSARDLSAALAAKAQGLEALKRGDTDEAAEIFDDAAELGAQAAAAAATEDGGSSSSSRAEAKQVRVSSLLNVALCRLKLGHADAANVACTTVLALEPSSAKAHYRRASARLKLARTGEAVWDLKQASRLSPKDADIKKLLAEAEAMLAKERAARLELVGAATDIEEAANRGVGLDGPSSAAGADAGGKDAGGAATAGVATAGKSMLEQLATAGKSGANAVICDACDEDGARPSSAVAPAAAAARAAGEGPSADTPLLRPLNVSVRTYAYLEVSIGGRAAGRLSLQLFDDLVPQTALNFRKLCVGCSLSAAEAGGTARTIGYTGTPFHRIVKGFVVQGGDVVAGDGSGGVSGLDGHLPFEDESFAVPHARPGVLSMANTGPNSNGCQFFLTLAAAAECDRKHVAFGRVLSGMPLLRRLEALPTDDAERPLEPALISGSGVLRGAEAEALKAAASFDAASELGADGSPPDTAGEALLRAATEGDMTLVRELVTRGVNVDAFGAVALPVPSGAPLSAGDAPSGEAETTALAVAARSGHLDMLRGLLQARASPTLADSTGRTPLHWAVLMDHPACVAALLDAAIEGLAARDADGKGPLHVACTHGHARSLRELLNRGRDSTARLADEASGLTPLHLASGRDHAECVDRLVTAQAPMDAKAAGELTPLHLAAARGAVGAVASLLAGRASCELAGDRSKKTALHSACEHGQAMVAGALLAANADVSALDARGSAPLHWASKSASRDLVAVLLGARAQADATTRDGSTPLHLACEASAHECARMLLRAKASATAVDAHGLAPLHAASAVGSADCAKLLLGEGADAKAAMRFVGKHDLTSLAETHTKSPLYMAAEHGHREAVQCLLDAHADADALATIETKQTVTRTSALWAAKRGGHKAVVAMLLAAGATEIAETISEDVSLDVSDPAPEGGGVVV